jgi:phosphoglycolate phosphatase-like HAD superfamily hydrolase
MKARKFKAVFFDLDGTLIDIRGPLYASVCYAFAQMGNQQELTRERYYELLLREGLSLGVPEESRRWYAKLTLSHFLAQTAATPFEVLPGVPEALAELKRRDYTTGVVTSRPGDPAMLSNKLDACGLAGLLDHVLTAPINNLRSLDKTESLKLACDRAAVPSAHCAYVGDEPRDTMAARNAGFGVAIAVATGAAGFEHLLTHPEFRPDYLLHSMDQLPDLLTKLEQDSAAA